MNADLLTLIRWLEAAYWPFLRLSALFVVAPLFGNLAIPVQIRVLLAAGFALLVASRIPAPELDAFSLAGGLAAAQEILLGAAMGFLLTLAFEAVIITGESISLSAGLGFASMVDPRNGVSVPVVSQLFLLLITLLFLSLNGHWVLLRLMLDSFETLPVGVGLTGADYGRVVAWASHMFIGGVLIGLPVVAALVVINLCLGVMTRAAPQLNLFSVGFPMTVMAGVVLLTAALPVIADQMPRLWLSAFETMQSLLTPES